MMNFRVPNRLTWVKVLLLSLLSACAVTPSVKVPAQGGGELGSRPYTQERIHPKKQTSDHEQKDERGILVGRIAYVEGDLLRYIPEQQNWGATVKDAPFALGDALYSNEKSKAEFIMPNLTWVRIGSSTQIQIIRLEDQATEVDVASGIVRFYGKSPMAIIKVTTPFGNVVALGQTIFDVYVTDEILQVVVIKGALNFAQVGTLWYPLVAENAPTFAGGKQLSSGKTMVDKDWTTWNDQRDSLWAERLEVKGDTIIYVPKQLHKESFDLEERGRWEKIGSGAPEVQRHAYSFLHQLEGEPLGYGMYTYVLFGRAVGIDAPSLPDSVKKRYVALLEAILSSTATASDLEVAGIPQEETNLFCIPAKASSTKTTLDTYDSVLSMNYLNIAMAGVVSDRKFLEKLWTDVGPFLISTLKPLNQIRRADPMLFADLSAQNPAAMREVIAAYKQRINRSAPDRQESFQPLRLTLLTLILDADDNVKFVKEAVADWTSK